MAKRSNANGTTVYVNFYDALHYATTGSGNTSRTFKVSDFGGDKAAMHAEIDRQLAEQKAKNDAFKRKVRSGDVVIEPRKDRIMRMYAGMPNRVVATTDPELVEYSQQRNIPAPTEIKYKKEIELHLDEGTGNTTLLIGSSKAGKSTTLMQIYDKYYKDDISILFSINSHIEMYKNRPKLIHCSEFSPKAQKLIRLEKYINSKTDNKYNFVNLFDDVIDVRHNKLLNELVMTYRNSRISSIICLQYSNLLSKAARANVNNVLLFSLNTDEAIDVAIKTFLREAFKKMGIIEPEMPAFYREVTKDHGFISIRPSTGELQFFKLKKKV